MGDCPATPDSPHQSGAVNVHRSNKPPRVCTRLLAACLPVFAWWVTGRPTAPPSQGVGVERTGSGIPLKHHLELRAHKRARGVTWWQVRSRAVQTNTPEMACAAVVIRNTGCSMAVGLPSGIAEPLGEAAAVVGDAGSGASAAPLTVMVQDGRRSLEVSGTDLQGTGGQGDGAVCGTCRWPPQASAQGPPRTQPPAPRGRRLSLPLVGITLAPTAQSTPRAEAPCQYQC